MPERTWQQLAERCIDRLQVYVGPSHTFDANERPELKGKDWPILSTTLVRKTPEAIASLGAISEAANGAPLRVGVECAGSTDLPRLFDLLHQLDDAATVSTISLNDSNGIVGPGWVEQFFANLPSTITSRLGFHFHNDTERAAKSAGQVIKSATEAGMAHIELDVSAFGHGERAGILAVSEAVQVLPERDERRLAFAEHLANTAGLFTRTQRDLYVMDPDKAASHYDADGQIRKEYIR
jgi:isopropylmalate/homocitrate/citramalate synthase